MALHLGFKIVTLMTYLFACISDEVRCISLLGGAKYNPATKYKFPTYYPTAIETKKAKFVAPGTPPLRFDVAVLEQVLLQNTGKSATVQTVRPTTSRYSGGVLFPDTYVYEKSCYYWTNRTDSKARAASTVDNTSEALEIVFIFWNEKYGNFTNALKHRNGLAMAAVPISVGLLPNPAFIPEAQDLTKIKEAGTQVSVEIGTTYLEYVTAAQIIYYAYPGSYTDEVSGETYFCATVTNVLILQRPFISRDQFQGFLNLRNYAGQPLTNQAPLHRDKRVPVVRGVGTIVVPHVG